MAERYVRIGVLQLAAHPAVVVGDVDLLAEPFLPRQQSESLSLLARRHVDIGGCLDSVRARYVHWQQQRLELLLSWLKDHGAPRVLALPECSVPFEALESVRSFARETDTIVLAGTHTLRRSDATFSEYRNLGVREPNCRELQKSPDAYASVLPIVWKKDTVLHLKSAPSIFELTDLDLNRTTPIAVRTVPVGSPKVSIATLVCAEALRLPAYQSKKPDLAFIVARERQPQRFEPHARMLTQNRTPVALANDAAFGGSFIRTEIDDRIFAWWFSPPLNGVLPIGEFYLEAEINLGGTGIQVGTSAPPTTARLVRVVPIFPDGAAQLDAEHKLRAAARLGDAVGIDAILREQGKHDSALQASRWGFVATAIRNRTLTPELLDAIGEHIATTGMMSLDDLERDLARTAESRLDGLLSNTHLPDEIFGQISKSVRILRERSAANREDPGGPLPTTLPIGRSTEIAEIRNFATKGKERLCLLTGLEGIGKTAIVSAALAQAGTRNLRVSCVPGISADIIFEYIVRSGDRVASGRAPRASFSSEELSGALNRFDVLWIDDAHYLLEGPSWRTLALQALIHAVVSAGRDANVRVILESRRRMPLELHASEPYLKRQIAGLPESDATAFFETHLRKTGTTLDLVHEDHVARVVVLVHGHPGLMALCAESAARRGLPPVIDDLEARRGFYFAAIERLVQSLNLSPAEKAIMQALGDCRVAIPGHLLMGVSENAPTLVARLVDACVVERQGSTDVLVARVVSDAASAFGVLTNENARQFHAGVSAWFATQAATAPTLAAFRAATEANYHATLAGLPSPCKLTGIFDDLLAVARKAYERENYARVIALLEPVVGKDSAQAQTVPEDLLGMFAEALAWSGDFVRAFQFAEIVVGRNPGYAWLYVDAAQAALHSHKLQEAQLALERADALMPGSYRVSLLKGRVCARDGDSAAALSHYRDAESRSGKDGWPAFYLSRALIWRGEYQEALEAAGRGRDLAEKESGRRALPLENALMQMEMLALLVLGKHDQAKAMLSVLQNAPDARPEVIVASAFVRAFYSKSQDEEEILREFDRALERLEKRDLAKSHTRAQIDLFRGKLREAKGDLFAAKEDYRRAVQSDPENMHMRICLLRVVMSLRTRAISSGASAGLLSDLDHELTSICKDVLTIDPAHAEARSTLALVTKV